MTHNHKPTRRDFLAASAVGLVALARGSDSLARDGSAGSELLYVGTYTDEGRTDGLHLVRMDRSSGKLEHIGSVESGANPSFLAIHPNGRVLYAANEIGTYKGRKSGAVSAFDIASETGNLTRRNEQPSEGGAPCYVSVDRSGKFVLVANYSGGNVALLPLQKDGSLSPATHVEQHTRSGPSPAGREAAHAHCIVTDPSNRFVLAADLGLDRVFLYRLDVEGKALRHVKGGDAVMRSGAGPRHIAFHPTLPLYSATQHSAPCERHIRSSDSSQLGQRARLLRRRIARTARLRASSDEDHHHSARGRQRAVLSLPQSCALPRRRDVSISPRHSRADDSSTAIRRRRFGQGSVQANDR